MSTQNNTIPNRSVASLWLTRLGIGVGLAVVGQLLFFQKPRDWNAYPPDDKGTLTQSDAAMAPRRTMKVLRWLDAEIYTPPLPLQSGSVSIITGLQATQENHDPKLLALDEQTGSVRWERSLDGDQVDDLKQKEGLLSVWANNHKGTNYGWHLLKFDTITGRPVASNEADFPTEPLGYDPVTRRKWQQYTLDPETCLSSLSDERESIYLIRGDLTKYKEKKPFVLEARQLRDGVLKWQISFPYIDSFESCLYLSQNHQTLYFIDSNSLLVALDTKTGRKRWKVKTLLPGGKSCQPRVATGPEGIIVVLGQDVHSRVNASSLRAYEETTGHILWQIDPTVAFDGFSSALPGPTIGANGIVYASIEGRMTAVNSKTGKALWSAKPPGSYGVTTQCSVGPDNTVYFGASNFGPSGRREGPIACVIAVQNGAVPGERN